MTATTVAEASARATKIVALTDLLRARGITSEVAAGLSTQAWEAAATLAGCTPPSPTTRSSVIDALAHPLPANPLEGLPTADNAFRGFR